MASAVASVMKIKKMIVFFSAILFLSVRAFQKDEHSEELFIKPLSKGYVYSHFQFTTKWNASIQDPKTFSHYHLFPKSLGEVLMRYGVQELHLSQTQGLWRHKLWGYPVHDAPPGAALWVWFKPTVKDVDAAWTDLVNAVSGLFCSSLNFLDSKITITPSWSFRPHGIAPKSASFFSHSVRYGNLPNEIVCTENLTPWKKLLPCDSKAGLSTLFNAFHFHDSNYHSLGLDVRPICANAACTEEALELSQSLSVVKDVVSVSPLGSPNWSLKSLFGNHLVSSCPIASKSSIMIEVTNNENESLYSLTPSPSATHSVKRGPNEHTYAVYDTNLITRAGRALNIAFTYSDPQKMIKISPPSLYAHRFITGYGLENGGISCQIYNQLSTNLTILYFDTLPWFTRVKFNSLQVLNNGRAVPYKVHYTPAKDRSRPHHLELSFVLWANSVTELHWTFSRAYLKWTEYPPDANHGFHIGSAVITAMIPSTLEYTMPSQFSSQLDSILFQSEENSTKFPLRIHTESLLVQLPTPDFSMPYNVICLTCTVVAIAFGSIHNLTTRRFTQLDPTSKKGLVNKIKSFFMRSKSKTVAEDRDQGKVRETTPTNKIT
ncbi:GPI transamidase component PIG-T-like [Physella acuta]|uniref:GPI transamidase component PIG-T-like n=1 Tax=Physella acuta TaxID=109671 RepID=UPI0027DBB421|nr:GPI transamidase component PIG-T-like [Physella acuta]